LGEEIGRGLDGLVADVGLLIAGVSLSHGGWLEGEVLSRNFCVLVSA
jgi:hypothetical protein